MGTTWVVSFHAFWSHELAQPRTLRRLMLLSRPHIRGYNSALGVYRPTELHGTARRTQRLRTDQPFWSLCAEEEPGRN